MRVRLAKTAGFCMGVRRAMELALSEANKSDGPLYTYGPLIHNEQVLDLLESKGVRSVTDLETLRDSARGRIIIRAHGIPPATRKALRASPLEVIDGTCPRVARVQAIIRYYTSKGHTALIVGDPEHAEVVGLVGYAKTSAYVIRHEDEVAGLPELDRVILVAQTTQDEKKYGQVTRKVKERFPDARVFQTICEATRQRQEEVRLLAESVDAVVVVGGYHSGNTQRLAQIARSQGVPTFHVETEKELDKATLARMELIGVTAGASTPNWMIKNVVKEIEGIRDFRDLPWLRWARKGFKFAVLSNFLAALGAFCLAQAGAVLSGRTAGGLYPFLTFLYIYAMNVLNRFLDKGASAYNDPERAAFYRNYKVLLIFSGLLAVTLTLVVAHGLGRTTFWVLCGLSLLGLLYSLPLVPRAFRGSRRRSRIKDIPGSKPLVEALAWVVFICVVPLLEGGGPSWPGVTAAGVVVFAMSYARSTLFDLFQFQGDLIVGAETLPITLGLKKTSVLLRVVLCVAAAVLLLSPVLGLTPPFSFLVLLSLAALSFCLAAYERRWIHPGPALEAMVEGAFILNGLLALLWGWGR